MSTSSQPRLCDTTYFKDDGFRAADINTAFLLSPPSNLLTLPSPVAHTLPDCRVIVEKTMWCLPLKSAVND
ncbi:hypothetical protein GBAR_LOCUS31881 [Geodia barretti]|uniref:Uncharacterized protein n=1 Tax=Geodia barretti TaxID=519541 RepID=A0AA35U392_GEOBA|nr:hypothetical protein GBAR_LOCUS31881 [Geodia barretti]